MKHFKYLLLVISLLSLQTNLLYSQGWVLQNSQTGLSLKSIAIIDANTAHICGYGGILLKTTNGGTNWLIKNTSGDQLFTLKFFNSQTGYAIGGDGNGGTIYKTTNAGENWNRTYIQMDSLISFFRCNFLTETTWYLIAIQYEQFFGTINWLYKTTNGGVNWTKLFAIIPPEYMSETFFVNENTGHIVTRRISFPTFGYHYLTTNGGNSWNWVSLGSNSYSVLFLNESTGFAGGDGGYIWKSTNGGSNWFYAQCCPGGLQGAFSFPGTAIGYSAGYGKIYKTTNTGSNWFNVSASFTNIVYYDIKFLNDTIGYCVGDAGTILKTTNGAISSIHQLSSTVPDKFSLYQNYPNPFNPSTLINFDIPKSSLVKLIVYDAMGREIGLLVNEELKPGAYDFDWDASAYPSGVYFYKITAGDYTQTKKMVLVK